MSKPLAVVLLLLIGIFFGPALVKFVLASVGLAIFGWVRVLIALVISIAIGFLFWSATREED